MIFELSIMIFTHRSYNLFFLFTFLFSIEFVTDGEKENKTNHWKTKLWLSDQRHKVSHMISYLNLFNPIIHVIWT